MALVLNDRVKETTTTTGTGTVNLAGAETGFESFVAGIGNSNTCYYAIVHQTADEFEVGLGTITDATPDTLARTTVISSSNSDSAVDFSAGTKDVFCTLPASKSVFGDSSGNVGIGETSPDLKLHVKSSGQIAKLETTASTGDCILTFADASANKGFVGFGSSSSELFQISNIENGDMKFETNNTERMRVTSSGKVGIGTSDPGADGYSFAEDFVIKSGASADDGVGLSLQSNTRRYGVIAFGDSANDNEGEIWYDHTLNTFNMRTANVQRFSLDSSGNAIFTGNVTAYGSVSDERLKENIKVIENPIEKIKDLKGVTFTYKKDGEKSTGLIAQDLEKVLPEAVYTSETIADEREGEESEEHLAIRYGNTVGLLVEAIKELEARVKELEDK